MNASPANIDRPMLSLGRPFMKSAATDLAASMRLGFRSSASILVETSMHIIMSMPSISVSCQRSVVWGRARIMASMANATSSSMNGRCMRYDFQLRPIPLNMPVEGIVSVALRLRPLRTYHTTAGIISRSSSRYALFAKVIFSLL